MDPNEFEAQAARALDAIEQMLEGAGADFERKEGGIVEIERADGSRIIVNRHAAAQEIWVAARSGGFHYRWDGSAWRDTRGGGELLEALARLIA